MVMWNGNLTSQNFLFQKILLLQKKNIFFGCFFRKEQFRKHHVQKMFKKIRNISDEMYEKMKLRF